MIVSPTEKTFARVCLIRGGVACAPVSLTERGVASEGGMASLLVMLTQRGVDFEGGVTFVLVITPTKGGMDLHLTVPQKEVWPRQ